MKESYHFIGIGGIGMSALARILLNKGAEVSGSDANFSPLTQELEKEGATLYKGHTFDAANRPAKVIYSTSIKNDNPEIQNAQAEGRALLHRSELLFELMQEQKALLVAGTHGKTTTSALLAALLSHAKLEPSFAVGGIVNDLKANGGYGRGEYFVAEADESDGSFLRYNSYGAIITSLGNDHLDHWKSEQALIDGFTQFAKQVSDHLVWCRDDPRLTSLNLPGISYGFSSDADVRISNYSQKGWNITFDITFEGKVYERVEVHLIGKHNALNSAAIFALALHLGIAEEAIRTCFKSFQGILRRVEHKGSAYEIAVYDDYGHHPSEVQTTLKAIRSAIQGRRLILAFQPHRYSRTRDLFQQFPPAFEAADELILTDIYPAGEPPIEGISTQALTNECRKQCTLPITYVPKEELLDHLVSHLKPYDVLVTMGAGDITKFGGQVIDRLKEGPPKTLNVSVLFGGRTCESKISLSSAELILSALQQSPLHKVSPIGMGDAGKWITGENALEQTRDLFDHKEVTTASFAQIGATLSESDICFPVCHGPYGEDGMIQGFLETLDIPYCGNDYAVSALTMDKGWVKEIISNHDIPTARFLTFTSDEWETDRVHLFEKIFSTLSFPLYVKPVHQGSSIGVVFAKTAQELASAIDEAALFDYSLIVEEKVAGRMIEFAVIGNETVEVAEPVELFTHGEMHDYENKYGPTAKSFDIPPNLPAELIAEGKEIAAKTYKVLGCKGLARIDFIMTPENTFTLIEVNPIPGCTPTSPFPAMWEKSGLSNEKLVERLLILGMQRKRLYDRKLRRINDELFKY